MLPVFSPVTPERLKTSVFVLAVEYFSVLIEEYCREVMDVISGQRSSRRAQRRYMSQALIVFWRARRAFGAGF